MVGPSAALRQILRLGVLLAPIATTGCERLAGLGDPADATPAPSSNSAGVGGSNSRGGEDAAVVVDAGAGALDHERGGSQGGNAPAPNSSETCVLDASLLDECNLQ